MGREADRPARRGRRRLGLAVLSALLLLVLAEGAARIYARVTLQQRGLGYDAALGWRPLPNVRKLGGYWGRDEPAFTNSHGWRDGEHAHERTPGVARWIALGDSFTFGVDADYGERFTERLEQDLGELEVVNLGVNAFGTGQQLRALEEYGLAYAPDVVVLVAFLGNDLDDIRNERKSTWSVPVYTLEDGELALRGPELDLRTWLRTRSYLLELLIARLERGTRTTVVAPEWDGVDSVPLFAALVDAMRQRSEAAGARFLCVLAYPRERSGSPPTPREARARAALEARGVETVDTLDAFSAAEEVLFGGRYAHWNEAGHRLVARLIEERARALGWL